MLSATAQLAAWQTPKANEIQTGVNAQGGDSLTTVATLASRETPRNEDGESAGMRHSRVTADTLTAQASWATPSSRDWKDSPGMAQEAFDKSGKFRNRIDQLARQSYLTDPAQLTASGATPSGSHAGTGKQGQLNPALSRWLMGLPPAWDDCAVMAMQSLPRRRMRSSAP
jgi:hypothetical protein